MTEFDDVIRLLEDGRPQATDLELDKIKQRIRRGQAAGSSGRKQSMKSRLTILAMVAFGMLFSTAGAGLAVSGISSNTNASVAQYGTPTPTPTPEGGVLPAEEEGGVLPAEETNNAPEGGVSPAGEEATQPTQPTQPTRQVEATTESQLPFTGFAAIPVMLGGIALLTGGLVLRRRTRAE
jgi:hypothetical protein